VKQTICAFLLFFSAIPAFSQTRLDTFVYVRDVYSGPPEERRSIQQNLKTGVRALGFSVTESIREADYLLSCSVKGDFLPLLVLALLNPGDVELASRDLVFTYPDQAYARFPEVLDYLFAGQPLRQRPAAGVSAAPGTMAAAARKPATGVNVQPGAAADQGPVSGEPETAAAIQPGESPVSSTGASSLDAWKHNWLFLNARLGVSNRYFLTKAGEPAVLLFTGEAGIEPEFHFANFFALQFGLNYAMDWDPRNSSPLNGTYILSVPFMAKFIFNTSTATTLGIYGGGYASFAILGQTTPPPLGILAGADLAIKAGPGAVLFDVRFSADMGSTDAEDDNIESYNRMFLTLSAGYKIGFVKRKAKPRS
jgi:hypothetical protein